MADGLMKIVKPKGSENVLMAGLNKLTNMVVNKSKNYANSKWLLRY